MIDTSKGLDVPDAVSDEVKAIEIEKPVEAILTPTQSETVIKTIQKSSIQQELQEASRIIKESKRAVASMFKDARLGKVVNAEAVMPLVEEISNSIKRNEGALISLVRLKTQDDYTYMHSVAVCAMMTALAKELGFGDTEVRQAGLAGLMHDIVVKRQFLWIFSTSLAR